MANVRKVNGLHSNAGALDSRELKIAQDLTIAANRQGIKVDRVKQGFGGCDPVVIDKDGMRWIPQSDGSFMSEVEIDELPDWDGEELEYSDDGLAE